jgi:opacity protein-like surface antigen
MRINIALLASAAVLSAVFAQSAAAADWAMPSRPAVAPAPSWNGLYVSGSAGATWLKANTFSSSDSLDITRSQQLQAGQFNPLTGLDDPRFFVTSDQTSQFQSRSSDNVDGQNTGAVFAAAMGYNYVYANYWLIGAQAEVSRNLVKTHMVGTGTSTNLNTSSGANFSNPFFLPQTQSPIETGSTTFNRFQTERTLSNDWTVSVLARIGVLATQEWLVYGLAGWSISGFELDDFRPFTLNGFTYGAGVERDFGWLRAFVQFKGINYNSKDFSDSSTTSSVSNQVNSFPGGAFQFVSTSASNFKSVQRVSVSDNFFVTAGVTVPLGFSR